MQSLKKIIFTVILLFSIILSPFQTQTVLAAAPDIYISDIKYPSEANGHYVWAGTQYTYDYWTHTAGATTYYLYNNEYSGTRYWNIDTDLNDSAILFYVASSAASPLGLTFTADSSSRGTPVLTNSNSPDILLMGGENTDMIIADGSTAISSANFTNIGAANVSGGTASRIITIYNTGGLNLSLSGSSPYVSISGAQAGSFSITQIPSQIISGNNASTTFEITFSPISEGYHNAVITINSNDPDAESSYSFNIQGYGFTPKSIVVSGITNPAAANGTYTHQGTINNFQYWKHESLNYYVYYDVFLNGGTYYGDWNIDNNTDDSSIYLYKESEAGTPVGLTSWSVSSGAGTPVIAFGATEPEINLIGNGNTIASNDLVPSFSDDTKFGSLEVSSGSRTRTYTIQNTGSAPLTITGVTLGGANAADFTNTNPVLSSIPASGNTTFTVTFDPSSEGAKNATITIANNDSDESSYIFSISGDAFTPKNLRVIDIVDPAAANGAYIHQGILNEFQYWKHATQNYYIYNHYFNTNYYWNIDTNLTDADNNYLFYKGSEAAVPVGLNAWISNATPGYVSSGAPTIEYIGSEMEVMGNGNSIPDGSSTPASSNDTDFGSISVVSGSVSHTFSIESIGFEDLNLNGSPIVAISGTNAADFTVTTQPTTPVPAMVGNTAFVVEFNPSAAGTRSATISIANDDSDENPYNFNIQGTGLAAPTITTTAAASVSTTSAVLGGNITNDGSDAVTERGVVYSALNSTPTIGGADVYQDINGSGTGSFSETISGLSLITHYYYQAYATNGQGTSYGGVQEFTTQNQIVSISRADPDPTNAANVSWNVEFSTTVTGLSSANFALDYSGLTGPAITGVSGSGTTWSVSANTGTGTGTLGINLTSDAGLNANLSNIPFSGESYSIDNQAPSLTINQAAGQSDPTNLSPINFTVEFSEPVTGFTNTDVQLSGSAGASSSVVTGSGTTYNVAVSGMSNDGTVIAAVAVGAAQDVVGNTSTASTSTDNQVTYDTDRPSVAVSSTAGSITNTSPIPVTITFSKPVSGFTPTVASGGLLITNGTDSNPAGTGTTYTFDLIPSGQGVVTIQVPQNQAQDSAGNLNTVSNTFSITYDSVNPTVTLEQATSQADPTDASPVNFTVTFSEAVTGFTGGDVTVGGTAGASTAVVTGSGTTYNVAVSGMTTNGTVTASLAGGAAQDAASNPSNASTSSDNEVNFVLGPVDVTVNQAGTQNDPANTLPLNFTAVFSRPIDLATFTAADVTLTGTAAGPFVTTITEVAPNDGTTFNIAVDGATSTGTVIANIAANTVQDPVGNDNNAGTSTDNTITYDLGSPTIFKISLENTLSPGPSSITVQFDEAVYDVPADDSGEDDVTNPANYILIEKGLNGISDLISCAAGAAPTSDDSYITVDNVTYNSTTHTSTVSVNGGIPLPLGSYVLYVCGTTSIVDLAGNPINNGLSDYMNDFRVIAAGSTTNILPATGFAPGQITVLPVQSGLNAYSATNLILEIPALGIHQSIVGIPKSEGWDVSWLGDQIGYLSGTAFPTWAGNSVLTGHVTDIDGEAGVFANLKTLKWGDQIIIHAYGQQYVYEVRTVNRWANPKDTSLLDKHEELPWVTLITCNGYNEKTDSYRWRTVVRAVQIRIIDED